MQNEFKWIPAFENRYDINKNGVVRSYIQQHVFRSEGSTLTSTPQTTLTPKKGSRGYYQVGLKKSDGTKVTKTIHVLILETFVGPRPKRQVGRHLDGDRANNTLDNLSWGTYKQNAADAQQHGTRTKGEKIGVSKLTEQQVLHILTNPTLPSLKLAIQLGVSRTTINHIRKGSTWKHVINKL